MKFLQGLKVVKTAYAMQFLLSGYSNPNSLILYKSER